MLTKSSDTSTDEIEDTLKQASGHIEKVKHP